MNIHQTQSSIFHLAIPTHDLVAAKKFYTEVLNCRIAREYDDRVTLDFFGDQLVCHLAPSEIEQYPKMYPRHFGRTFLDKSDFERIVESAEKYNVKFLEKPSIRFPDRAEKHLTLALLDPSNNVIEFKYYFVADYVY
ncbi:MAG: VOC family protein [Microcoleaceae cyanobacterium]